MTKVIGAVVAVVVLIAAGGAVFLATWDIPSPLERVEKAIPNDRFAR